MLNEELVRRLAHGDKEALETINTLPTSMKMSYGLAVDEMRRKESIVPINNGFEVLVQPKAPETDPNGVAEAFKKLVDERKGKEAAEQKLLREQTEKRAKQMAERARALGSYQ